MIRIIEDFLIPEITWAQFKDFIEKFNLSKVLRYIEFETEYLIWVEESGATISIRLKKGTNEASDFETNYKNNVIPIRTKDGREIITTTTHHIGKGLNWIGLPIYEIPAGTTQYFYYRQESIIELQGGRYIAVNGNHNDRGEFAVVIKGSAPEQDTILKKFIDLDIYPNKLEEFTSDQTTTINFNLNPNLNIRIKYISTGTENVILKVRLLIWT